MKKFLAILLITCTLLSVSALAAETTFVEPFTFFDFGSKSKCDDMFKENLLTFWELTNAKKTENEDSWKIWCNFIPEYTGAVTLEIPQIRLRSIEDFTFGAFPLNSGWSTYKPTSYDSTADDWVYGNTSQWIGKNQFVKLRVKNMTDNDRMGLYFQRPSTLYPSEFCTFEVSANDTEFQAYVFDVIKGIAKGTFNGHYINALNGVRDYVSNTDVIGFYAFGSYSPSGKALANDITYMDMKLGATVEIDYIIFAPTAEMAASYKSYDEEGVDFSTTTVEETTTTTAKVEETTTTEAVVDETTTTEAVVDETTTTEAVVDETTTTEAVVDETTTTTVADGTTTTANGGNDQKDGGFPVWIIIVIVVVIGGGIAAFFVFKK